MILRSNFSDGSIRDTTVNPNVKFVNGFEVSTDNNGNEVFEKHRTLYNYNGNLNGFQMGRLETLTFVNDKKHPKLYKSVHNGNITRFKDSIDALNGSILVVGYDMNTGRRSESYTEYNVPYDGYTQYNDQARMNVMYNELGLCQSEEVENYIDSCVAIQNPIKSKVGNMSFTNSLEVMSDINRCENCLQVGYGGSVGFVRSFFTKWGYSYPFESLIIIDTELCQFNVKNFKLIKFVINNDIATNLYKEFVKELDAFVRRLSENCSGDGGDFRIQVLITPYAVLIDYYDKHTNTKVGFDNINTSELASSIVSNTFAGTPEEPTYRLSEEYNIVFDRFNHDLSKIDDLGDNVIPEAEESALVAAESGALDYVM